MDNYNNYYNLGNEPQQSASSFAAERSLSKYVSMVMRKVYVKMTLALVVTTLASLFLLSNPALCSAIFASKGIFFGLMIAELALVMALSGAISRLSTSTATILFYLYSVLNGVVLTSIFFVYSPESILLTFCITAGVFLAMSIFGYVTKQDLTKFGTFLFMALIGLILCSVVNIFLHSSAMDWAISFAGVAIFIGLTAWDTQKIKEMAYQTDESNVGKLATIGALSLYLDFINIFLYLLRFFGNNRN